MLKTILLADDSSTIRKIVELTFNDTGIRVEAVETGREAMETFERLRPDLVLADVVMPEPSGYEICRSIKSSDHPVPVVLLAGTFEPFDEQQARECGADDHLIKPFESETLLAKVHELLEEPPPEAAEPQPVAEEAAPANEEEAPDTRPVPVAEKAQPSPELVEAVARAVVGRLSEEVVREIARELVPDLATQIIRERIRELETGSS